jgi:hypothetical protein
MTTTTTTKMMVTRTAEDALPDLADRRGIHESDNDSRGKDEQEEWE